MDFVEQPAFVDNTHDLNAGSASKDGNPAGTASEASRQYVPVMQSRRAYGDTPREYVSLVTVGICFRIIKAIRFRSTGRNRPAVSPVRAAGTYIGHGIAVAGATSLGRQALPPAPVCLRPAGRCTAQFSPAEACPPACSVRSFSARPFGLPHGRLSSLPRGRPVWRA